MFSCYSWVYSAVFALQFMLSSFTRYEKVIEYLTAALGNDQV